MCGRPTSIYVRFPYFLTPFSFWWHRRVRSYPLLHPRSNNLRWQPWHGAYLHSLRPLGTRLNAAYKLALSDLLIVELLVKLSCFSSTVQQFHFLALRFFWAAFVLPKEASPLFRLYRSTFCRVPCCSNIPNAALLPYNCSLYSSICSVDSVPRNRWYYRLHTFNLICDFVFWRPCVTMRVAVAFCWVDVSNR